MQTAEEQRIGLVAAYSGKCQYCSARGARDIEHIVPRSKGGADDLTNITLACKRCNSMKSALSLPEPYKGILLARAVDRLERVVAAIYENRGAARKGKWAGMQNDQFMVWVWLDRKPTARQAERLEAAYQLTAND